MTKNPILYITHISEAITSIQTQIEGITKEKFKDSELLQGFVERKLEIIGEATKRIPDDFKQKHPNSFITFDEFTKGPFSKIQKRIDTCMVSQAHLLYFQWLYSITSLKVNDCNTLLSFTK